MFARFSEATYERVSGPGFFVVCVAIVAAWALSYPLFSSAKSWQVVIHTVGSVLTLLLLVLLENASKRAEEAAQEKLNVIAEGLAALMESGARSDPELRDAAARLRDAVGLEERH
ncbi:MAG: low affinity iron permease family protein [Nocardioides sp.]